MAKAVGIGSEVRVPACEHKRKFKARDTWRCSDCGEMVDKPSTGIDVREVKVNGELLHHTITVPAGTMEQALSLIEEGVEPPVKLEFTGVELSHGERRWCFKVLR